MKDIFQSTLQGVGIGSSLMLIFIVAVPLSIGWTDIIGIYFFGGVSGFLSIVYKSENLSLFLQLIIHLGGSVFAFFAVASWNHWMPMQFSIVVSSLTIFILIFLIIWFINFFINIRQSKKINAKLKQQ